LPVPKEAGFVTHFIRRFVVVSCSRQGRNGYAKDATSIASAANTSAIVVRKNNWQNGNI